MSNKNFPKCGTECWASLSSIIIYFRINSPEKYKNESLSCGKKSDESKINCEKLLKEVRVSKTRWTTGLVNFLEDITIVLQ